MVIRLIPAEMLSISSVAGTLLLESVAPVYGRGLGLVKGESIPARSLSSIKIRSISSDADVRRFRERGDDGGGEYMEPSR